MDLQISSAVDVPKYGEQEPEQVLESPTPPTRTNQVTHCIHTGPPSNIRGGGGVSGTKGLLWTALTLETWKVGRI